jgi:amino-acid N-acetyltransferase
MAIYIERAQPDEKEAVLALLRQNKLPVEDLPAGLPDFLIARDEGTFVGVAGLESFESVGLLRSVAVDRTCWNKGIGAQLINQLLALADASHLQELYLITNTAEGYFTRYGFVPVDRETVPEIIRRTPQFSGLCPSSAIVMKRSILTPVP